MVRPEGPTDGKATRKRENGWALIHLKYFHDGGVVRASQIQTQLALAGDCGELSDRVLRICFSGAGESYRRELLQPDATEDHAGMHHADRLHRVRVHRLSRATALEQPRLLRPVNRGRRIRLLAALTRLHSGVQNIRAGSSINVRRVK